ncbi:MAG: extracellular solute-binding protein [Chloroflexota bacterium]
MIARRTLRIFVSLFVLASIALTAMTIHAQTPTEVKVWIAFQGARLDWTKARADEFNKQFPQFKVTVEGYSGYEELQKATDLAIQQKNAPAVVQQFEAGTQRARDLGYYKPIADALGDKKELNGLKVDFEDFVPVISNYYVVNGKWTSMPWNTSTSILYANADQMKAAGIDKVPATWQELEADCAKINAKKAGLKVDGCISWPDHGWFFEQWVAQQNATLANNDNGRSARATEVLLDSRAAINVATWWQNMYKNGNYIYTGKQLDWDGVEGGFSAGKFTFIISSSGDAGDILTAAKPNNINVVAGKMPYDAKAGYAGNIIGGASLWLVKDLDPKVEEGALTWLLFLTDTKNAADWHKISGYIPIRASAAKALEDEGWFKQNPVFAVGGQQLADSKVTFATQGAIMGTFPGTRDLVTGTMESLMLKGGDPVEAFKKIKTDADKLLADYNSLNVADAAATPAK